MKRKPRPKTENQSPFQVMINDAINEIAKKCWRGHLELKEAMTKHLLLAYSHGYKQHQQDEKIKK